MSLQPARGTAAGPGGARRGCSRRSSSRTAAAPSRTAAGRTSEAQARKLRLAADNRIESADVVEVVERVGERFTLTEGKKKSVLQRLREGGDLTRYGLHAAITRASADVQDYDRATELERLGGRVILPPFEWNVISQGALHIARAIGRAAS